MKFLQYILSEAKSKRLSESDAVDLIRQFHQKATPSSSMLHALVHRNTSDLNEHRFSSRFTGEEFFLSDHVVGGRKVLPGVAQLELARVAVSLALGAPCGGDGLPGVGLAQVVFARPVVVGQEGLLLHIALERQEGGEVAFEIYSGDGDDEVVHSQGRAVFEGQPPAGDVPRWDLGDLSAQCTGQEIAGPACYELFKAVGLAYGPAMQALVGLKTGRDGQGRAQVLGQLVLPEAAQAGGQEIVLHPSVMDGALQATAGLMLDDGQGKAALPFALEQLQVLAAVPRQAWVWARYSAGSRAEDAVRKLDVDVLDDQGQVCVRLRGFSTRVVDTQALAGQTGQAGQEVQTLLVKPVWQAQEAVVQAAGQAGGQAGGQAVGQAASPAHHRHLVVMEEGALADELQVQLLQHPVQRVEIVRLQSQAAGVAERYGQYAGQLLDQLQALLQGKPQGKVLVQLVVQAAGSLAGGGLGALLGGLGAMLKSAGQENPKLVGQVLEMHDEVTAEGLAQRLMAQAVQAGQGVSAIQVRYVGGQAQVATLAEVDAPQGGQDAAGQGVGLSLSRPGGVYLITGGAGGLGQVFAKALVDQNAQISLVLTGRSPLDEGKQALLQSLRERGAKVQYEAVDVGNAAQVRDLIGQVIAEHGQLNGVIHSAGVLRDSFVIHKTQQELQEVLGPKVGGVVALDEATCDLALEYFVAFSSTAGVLGNVGQADYAAGNAFMDEYMRAREQRVSQGQGQGQGKARETAQENAQGQGRSVSVNWPLWAQGGMQVDEGKRQAMWRLAGLAPLPTEAGVQALGQALGLQGTSQVVVLAGQAEKIRRAVLNPNRAAQAQPVAPKVAKVTPASQTTAEDSMRDRAIRHVTGLLSAGLKLPAHRIDASASLDQYGMDSVLAMELVNALEVTFGPLPKTLFFEYQSIEALAGFLMSTYPDQLKSLLGLDMGQPGPAAVPVAAKPARQESDQAAMPAPRRRKQRLASLPPGKPGQQAAPGAMDIAIIGISGRYPQARTPQAFWANLLQGVDSIMEIPAERWDHSRYFDAQRGQMGKTYAKWGGFIDGVDEFDPLFFNISPREAIGMDPQERLFLQCAHAAMEDAGYTRQALCAKHQGNGLPGNVGVFVGVMWSEYQLYGAQSQIAGPAYALSGNPSSIANRVSYHGHFHGPSLALDTMCSSSLTAIHLACQNILNGSCEVAIAGGVNVSVHPNKYLALAQGQFAASDGRCRSFGEGGDGYVPGEGVGAVLLKPLAKAIEDGDQIHGVIKGSAINHGGKTNGYTVPNPVAQAHVVAQALKAAQIPARAISYVEAHGTGTSLGDPIEISGLSKAYGAQTKDTGFCAIGSAKSNIGHCESAAGMAGLTKVLLQMKHQTLVPSLHSQTLNPHIDFEKTPFVVQRELAPWHRPMLEEAGRQQEWPRIAGLSSFGAGGSNAHLIIEEYIAPPRSVIEVSEARPVVILLSARDEDRLKEQARQLLEAIETQGLAQGDLADMAYTLQVGREAMEARLGMVVGSMLTLQDKLTRYVDGELGIADVQEGHVKHHKDAITLFRADEELQEAVGKWIIRGKVHKLLDLWVKGLPIDWDQMHADAKPRRISLPTYPFARQPCWVPGLAESPGSDLVTPQPVPAAGRVEATQTTHAARLPMPTDPQVTAEDAVAAVAHLAPVAWKAPAIAVAAETLSAAADFGRMEDTLALVLHAQFNAVGMFDRQPLDLAGWASASALPRGLQPWLRASLDALVARGRLAQEGEHWVLTPGQAAPSLQDAWARWEADRLSWEASRFAAYARLLDATLRALPDIMAGRRAATAVMFPQGSMQLVEGVYKNNLVADHFNAALAECLMAYIKARLGQDPNARFRILEIGAGTGGTSALLFDHLAGYASNISEYCYTDISPSFLLHATEHFSERAPYLQTRRFNVEHPPQPQGFQVGAYDIVLATNVLHATRKMDVTLRHAKALLKGGGLIFINEITGSSLFTHLTFGLLEGWWLHEDGDLRVAGSPALSPEGWRRALRAQGFEEPLFPAQQAHELGQQIVVAASDGVIQTVIDEVGSIPAKGDALHAGRSAMRPAKGLSRADQGLHGRTSAHLRALIAHRLGMPVAALDPGEPLARYGLDSISGAQITTDLTAQFGELSATLLFEHSTVAELAEHMVHTKRAFLTALLAQEEEVQPEPSVIEPSVSSVSSDTQSFAVKRERAPADPAAATEVFDAGLYRDVLERLAQGHLGVEDALALTQ